MSDENFLIFFGCMERAVGVEGADGAVCVAGWSATDSGAAWGVVLARYDVSVLMWFVSSTRAGRGVVDVPMPRAFLALIKRACRLISFCNSLEGSVGTESTGLETCDPVVRLSGKGPVASEATGIAPAFTCEGNTFMMTPRIDFSR